MTKAELLKSREQYFKSVDEWFINELKVWSKTHNMYVEEYRILRMWVIGSDEIYEPYSHHNDEEQEKKFEPMLKHYERIISDLKDLDVDTWQGLAYTDEHQYIH